MGRIMKILLLTCIALMMGTIQMKFLLIETQTEQNRAEYIGGEAGTDYSDDNYGDDEKGNDDSDDKGKDSGNKVDVLSGLFKPLDKFIKAILPKGKDSGSKGGLLSGLFMNKKLIKASLPKILNVDYIFNFLDMIMPGMKGIQADLVKTYNIIKKYNIFWGIPEFLNKIMPTFKQLATQFDSGHKLTDEDNAILGKALTEKAGQYIPNFFKALRRIPFKPIHDKLVEMDLNSIIAKFLDGDHLDIAGVWIDTIIKALEEMSNIAVTNDLDGEEKGKKKEKNLKSKKKKN